MFKRKSNFDNLSNHEIKCMLLIEVLINHYTKTTEFMYSRYFKNFYSDFVEADVELSATYFEIVNEKAIFREFDLVYYIILRRAFIAEFNNQDFDINLLIKMFDKSIQNVIDDRYSFLKILSETELESRQQSYLHFFEKVNETAQLEFMQTVYKNAFGEVNEDTVYIEDIFKQVFETGLLFNLIGSSYDTILNIKKSIFE